MISIRPARLPEDAAAIGAIDTSFVTDRVLDVKVGPDSIRLTPRLLKAPLTKRFALDDLNAPDRLWDHGFAAVDGGACRGFAAVGLQAWNRRLVLWGLYVDAPFRRLGLAARLVDRALEHGQDVGASHLWLETSCVNTPAVEAYRRLGFELCGADAMLYASTPAAGEVALFFARPI